MMNIPGFTIYPNSIVDISQTRYALFRNTQTGIKKILVIGNIAGFKGVKGIYEDGILCDLTPENALELRLRLDWLSPKPLGITKSFGFGDRLGIATPGHIASLDGFSVAPVFAQQSVRENSRTGRSPQNVLDDAMWGVFQMGWRKPWGADADHIKSTEVLDAFVDAGYSMFTIDPGDHVDQHADEYPQEILKNKLCEIPWDVLQSSEADFYSSWLGKEVPALGIVYDEKVMLKAIIKYGHAIAHTSTMFKEISKRKGNCEFDLEVSVDETDSPTTIAEHYFIANELRRLGLNWTSLAPRFVGRFEKGVDFIGDLDEFDHLMHLHAKVAHHVGGYKISLHSGSDKFSVYPSVNRYTEGMLHVKTAGTSYLEALRVVAELTPEFFNELLTFAQSRYDIDKATYHVSGEVTNLPKNYLRSVELLDHFDARQVFHVTFGSVLDRYGTRIFEILKMHEDVYYTFLEKHLRHHLELLQ